MKINQNNKQKQRKSMKQTKNSQHLHIGYIYICIFVSSPVKASAQGSLCPTGHWPLDRRGVAERAADIKRRKKHVLFEKWCLDNV